MSSSRLCFDACFYVGGMNIPKVIEIDAVLVDVNFRRIFDVDGCFGIDGYDVLPAVKCIYERYIDVKLVVDDVIFETST